MKSFLISVLIVVFITFSFIPTSVFAENEWLLGTWELYYDPDGYEKDRLEFKTEGIVYGYSPDNPKKIPGTYKVTKTGVLMNFKMKGRYINLAFSFKPTKEALYFYSIKTRNTSIYKKINIH